MKMQQHPSPKQFNKLYICLIIYGYSDIPQIMIKHCQIDDLSLRKMSTYLSHIQVKRTTLDYSDFTLINFQKRKLIKFNLDP